ncbi:Putative ribosomal pseudouridine synthase [hydrothermal vent metagenome]|uniref:Putative ribosomal pseudouridine synthase n=1 Tax=hydrothermal vent metagenome TaxID=652676 RepID=A0A1W1D8D3_9ZZZZ
MPFVLKQYPAIQGEKIQHFLINNTDLSGSQSQKLLSKNRVFDDQNNILKNGDTINCQTIQVAVFEGHSRGLKPIFETPDFAVFDKPSGVMVHPTRKTTEYCLLDEVRYFFGDEASLAHRIDAETSGLVLVAKNKQSSRQLKMMFEHRQYNKEYLALVRGQVLTDLTIEKPISKADSNIRMKMTCDSEAGKQSKTFIHPLKFNESNQTTMVKAIPVTGRQHQIRVHLDSVGHSIIGDPIYGVNESIANEYLCKTLSDEKRLKFTGANRLMLHAHKLSFSYKEVDYNITSKQEKTVFSKFFK